MIKIHGIFPKSEIQFDTFSSITDCFTKIDKVGYLNVCHPPNVLLINMLPWSITSPWKATGRGSRDRCKN